MKILNESHVPNGIATKDLEQILRQQAETNTITLKEDELTLEWTGHVKSLHIAIECKGMIIFKVLIVNLNVCQIMILNRIGVDDSPIRPNSMMVRAFDGIKIQHCRGFFVIWVKKVGKRIFQT